MSSSRPKRHQTAAVSSTNPQQNTAALPTLPKLTHSFEESQFLYLQYMIDKMAMKMIAVLNEQEHDDPSALLPQLRIYAQYMNLYMKFKEKCIVSENPIPKQPQKNKEMAITNQFRHAEMEPGNRHPQNKNVNQLQSSNNQSGSTRLHDVNTSTALLMQPKCGA